MTLPFITIVSGLPRSGTSLMMQVLEAGGLKPIYDEGVKPRDHYNPKGYYEVLTPASFQTSMLKPRRDLDELGDCIKVLGLHLGRIRGFNKALIYMEREPREILESNRDFIVGANKNITLVMHTIPRPS